MSTQVLVRRWYSWSCVITLVPTFISVTETLTITTLIGQNYFVRIQNYAANAGFNGQLRLEPTAAALQ